MSDSSAAASNVADDKDPQHEKETEKDNQHLDQSGPPRDTTYVDITSLIDESAKDLSFEQPYLCDEATFSLHESMAALELMDRKMDCCEITVQRQDGTTVVVPPRPLPNGIDSPEGFALPWEDLTLTDAADFAVELLTRLEALLRGASTAESTYTCLYAHNAVIADMQTRLEPANGTARPNGSLTEQLQNMTVTAPTKTTKTSGTVAQHVVYATTLGLVEASDLIRDIILHADIFEEEDFGFSTFGLNPATPDETTAESNEQRTQRALAKAAERIKGVLTKRSVSKQDQRAARKIQSVIQFLLLFLRTCATMVSRIR